jgi:hypothetical protein
MSRKFILRKYQYIRYSKISFHPIFSNIRWMDRTKKHESLANSDFPFISRFRNHRVWLCIRGSWVASVPRYPYLVGQGCNDIRNKLYRFQITTAVCLSVTLFINYVYFKRVITYPWKNILFTLCKMLTAAVDSLIRNFPYGLRIVNRRFAICSVLKEAVGDGLFYPYDCQFCCSFLKK